MLYTILFSLLIILIFHILYTQLREYLTPLKIKDEYVFHNDKVRELIDLLKKDAVDFSAMEGELATLIDNETDIKTSGDSYLDVTNPVV